MSAEELLRRPTVRYWQVRALTTDEESVEGDAGEFLAELDDDIATEVELEVKYAGYLRKEEQSVLRAARLEESLLPSALDYGSLSGLRTEARYHLQRVRPYTLGQASRIPGVTPSDIAVLLVHVERLRHRRQGA
jgi:tRNA uridine 5-carboxymethylaminomethyl modification enzyme